MKTVLFLTIYFSFFQLLAQDFSSIKIDGWSKEELAHDHLRFTHPEKKRYSLHLQVDSYNEEYLWKENSLYEDMKKMENLRKTMSSFLGMKNYQIHTLKFKNKTLEMTGSYIRPNKQLIHFKEINFYNHKKFLQFKIISEEIPPTDTEIERLIKEINPSQVDLS